MSQLVRRACSRGLVYLVLKQLPPPCTGRGTPRVTSPPPVAALPLGTAARSTHPNTPGAMPHAWLRPAEPSVFLGRCVLGGEEACRDWTPRATQSGPDCSAHTERILVIRTSTDAWFVGASTAVDGTVISLLYKKLWKIYRRGVAKAGFPTFHASAAGETASTSLPILRACL